MSHNYSNAVRLDSTAPTPVTLAAGAASGNGSELPQQPIPPPPPAPNGANIRWQPEPPSTPPTLDDSITRQIVEAVNAATLAAAGKGRKPTVGAKLAAAGSRVPQRTRVFAGAGVLIVGAGLAWRSLMPAPVDTAQVAAVATRAATAQALEATRADLARARAESTQIVVADAFAWAPLPLTETARSIIGYDASTGFQTLDQARSEVVAKQARALLVGVPITQLRLVANSPTDLRVTSNPGEGVALFETVAPQKQTAATPTTTTTAR